MTWEHAVLTEGCGCHGALPAELVRQPESGLKGCSIVNAFGVRQVERVCVGSVGIKILHVTERVIVDPLIRRRVGLFDV